ncbi:MAG: S8 family serine peptidase [Patescibacteria group bacterium]
MVKAYLMEWQKSSVALLLAIVFVSFNFAEARVPDDPRFFDQEPVYRQISAPGAWDYATSSEKVVVAVIDTGVDINNADLEANVWVNTGEIAPNGLDDDGNGYIDDVNGWNFVENNNKINIPDIIGADDSGAVSHGTVLAGLVGAVGNNGIHGAGMSWKVKLMPIRAIDNSGGGSLATVSNAVDYAVKNGADIIVTSFVGVESNSIFKESFYNAYKKGVLVVSAAGNNADFEGDFYKTKRYPVCLDAGGEVNWILGVTSVDLRDKVSMFANTGECVDLSVPGEGIYSTQKYAPQSGFSKEFDGPWYGSSFSVPLVAGTAALLKSIRPEWRVNELIEAILKSSDDIEPLNPSYVGKIGYGRLNVLRAVTLALESAPKAIVPETPLVFDAKLVKKNKNYIVRVSSNKKILREFLLPNYSEKSSKWATVEGLLILADLKKGKLTVNTWDWSGRKKLTNLVLSGITSFSSLKIDTVWGDSPNAILFVKRAGENQRLIIDLPSRSWKAEEWGKN